jgi:hypothetical protein
LLFLYGYDFNIHYFVSVCALLLLSTSSLLKIHFVNCKKTIMLYRIMLSLLLFTTLQINCLAKPPEGKPTNTHKQPRYATDADLQKLLHDYDSARQVRNLQWLGKERNMYSTASKKQLDDVRRMIRQTFGKAGLSVHSQQFEVGGFKGENIIGELRSKKQGAKTLVVGAHYDTVEGSPGVDDNGTGVAALLEVATILSKYKFDCNIKFVALDLEEVINSLPNSGEQGSAALVNSGLAKDDISGFINLDMIGYSTDVNNSQHFPQELAGIFPDLYTRVQKDSFRGDFLLVISNDASAAMAGTLQSVGTKFIPSLNIIVIPVPGKGEDMPDFRRSDHARFWDKGYQAISLGDGAFSRNPHYHSGQDQFPDINLGFMASVTRLLLLTIAQQGEMVSSE